jgi:hypothetical protein
MCEQETDPTRLVDTNSGGPANNLHVGDVNDIHSYPWPGNPVPSALQYAMVRIFLTVVLLGSIDSHPLHYGRSANSAALGLS